MYKKSTSSCLAASLVLSLATAYMPAVAAVVNADWINGSGNYSDFTKWNIPAVPCNAGTTTFNVNIPASIGTVSMDVLPPDCTVDTLTLGANSTFNVLSGNSYTVLGLADIAGIVRGNGGDFLATIATFSGNTARASASGGAMVQIGAPSYLATGLISATLFSSTGTGSVLNLSTLQSIDSSFNDSSTTVRANTITASSDASLDLSGVTAITAPARGEDRLDVNVTDTAVINLSSLTTIGGGGQTRFVVTAGGVQLLPALQTVSRGRFDVSGGGQLSTAGSAWTYINQLASVPLFTVSGTGSVLNLSTLQSIDSSFNDSSTTVRANTITASSDASLDLSSVTAITAPTRGEDRLDVSVTDTAVINLSSLTTISGGGQTRFAVTAGGVQLLPALQTVSRGRFDISGGGQLSTAGSAWTYINQLASVPLFTCTGPGSILDLSTLQSIDSSFNDSSTTVRANTITASGGCILDVSGVTTIIAPARGEDRLDVSVTDTAVINLSSLTTIGGGGQTRFVVTAGGVQLLPVLQTVSRGRFDVSGGGQLSTAGSAWTYINQLASVPLFTVSGTGSVLNLSTLQSIDSSFNDSSTTVRANTITASSDASLDLSSVTAITAPARGEDRLDVSVTDTAVINLSSLTTISGGGQTRFNVTDGGVQLLPALETVSRGRFDVSGGGQLSTADSAWTYINQLASVPLFTCSGPGSILDLSTLQSIDSSFNDSSTTVRVNTITASDSCTLDLSGVTAVTAPARGEDRLDFVVNDGELRIGAMENASGGGAIRMLLNDPLSLLVAPASFKPHTKLTITAVADATVRVGKDYSFKHTNENSINLESAVVQFDGSDPQFVEVGGFDISTLTPIGPNFGFGQMIIGTDLQATTVYLRDGVNNGNGHVLCGPGEEALYLLGLPADPANPGKIINGLRILGGSTLVLNGIPLYTLQDGVLIDVRTWFPPGQTLITYALNNSNGFIELGSSPDTDADADGVIDDGLIDDVVVQDNCVLVANADQRDTNGDGYGNRCDPDLNNDLVVQAADLAIFKPLFFSTDPDADFDGNGRVQAGDLAIMKKFFFQPPGPSCVAP